MNAEQIDKLSTFQSVTGLEDVNECVRQLELAEWNTQRAIERYFEGPYVNEREEREIGREMVSSTNETSSPWWTWGPLRVGWNLTWQLASTAGWMARQYLPLLSRWAGNRGDMDRNDPAVAARKFVLHYEQRFGMRHPIFYQDGYMKAMQEVKNNYSFLMVYLHSDEHEDSERFCRLVLSSEELIRFLSTDQFIVWAGDIQESEAYQVADLLEASSFPFIAIMMMQDGRLTLVNRIEGFTDIGPFMTILRDITMHYTPMLVAARADREEREINRKIREEQDVAYQESLQADREKERRLKDERERLINEQQTKELLAAQEHAKKRAKASELETKLERIPEEPTPTEPDITRIIFRLPNGGRIERRFRLTDTIQLLYDFIDTRQIGIEQFNLCSNFPRTCYSDGSITLADARLCPNALLFIEEKFD